MQECSGAKVNMSENMSENMLWLKGSVSNPARLVPGDPKWVPRSKYIIKQLVWTNLKVMLALKVPRRKNKGLLPGTSQENYVFLKRKA